MFEVAVTWIVLHGLDGSEIHVRPEHITNLRPMKSDPTAEGKLFVEGVHCMVNLDDGKYISVVETCSDIWEKLR